MEISQSSNDDNPKSRFVRYLFIGKEYGVYHAGSWKKDHHFTLEILTSVEELASDIETELFPITKIKEIYESNLFIRSESLIFALAVCSKQEKSEKLRQSTYDFIAENCKTAQHFMLFISYASMLSKQSAVPRHGWGHGWRNAVNRWYLSKDAMELAKIMTKYKSRYGWKHKDIIKLSHPITKGSGIDIKVVFRYIMYGLEKTKLEFENESKAREILEFIQRIEDLRHCDDAVTAAGLIRTYDYTIEYVNSHLIKSTEVWIALIESMDFTTLIKKIHRINNLGLLTPNSQISEKILSAISNKNKILQSKIHPMEILMAIKNFQDPNSIPGHKQKCIKKTKKPKNLFTHFNKRIVDALYSALDKSFSNVKSTGLKYFLSITLCGLVKKNFIKPWIAEAASIILLGLLRAEDHVILSITYDRYRSIPLNIKKDISFKNAVDLIHGHLNNNVQPIYRRPLVWASQTQQRKYDVLINIADRIDDKHDFTGRIADKINESHDFTERAFRVYKKRMEIPNSRLVEWIIDSHSTTMEGRNISDVLTICGFDIYIPQVIEAYVKKQF